MFVKNLKPAATNQLEHIFEALTAKPAVQLAVLATSDGLPVLQPRTSEVKVAAIASFMVTTVRQAGIILGLNGRYNELIIHADNNTFFVCKPFPVGQSQLILAILFQEKTAYRRLFADTIKAVYDAVGY